MHKKGLHELENACYNNLTWLSVNEEKKTVNLKLTKSQILRLEIFFHLEVQTWVNPLFNVC